MALSINRRLVLVSRSFRSLCAAFVSLIPKSEADLKCQQYGICRWDPSALPQNGTDPPACWRAPPKCRPTEKISQFFELVSKSQRPRSRRRVGASKPTFWTKCPRNVRKSLLSKTRANGLAMQLSGNVGKIKGILAIAMTSAGYTEGLFRRPTPLVDLDEIKPTRTKPANLSAPSCQAGQSLDLVATGN